jgi:glycosyltransferase involved in cell wall biosynthesis
MDDTGKNISVIIPAYNMGDWVGPAIESVANTSVEGVEVIVVDDGSEDATPSVVRRYAEEQTLGVDVRFYRQENQGKSNAVNRGLREAHGDYVSILDADDQIADGGLDVLFRSRVDDEGTSYPMVVGGFEVFNRSGEFGCRVPPLGYSPEQLHERFYLHWRTPFHLNACLLSRDLISKVGGFDERLQRCVDGDYALRLLDAVGRVQAIDEVVYRYRKHRSSPLNRARYRVETARYRPQVIWKNYRGWRRWLGVPFGLAMDAGKLMYELVDYYKK